MWCTLSRCRPIIPLHDPNVIHTPHSAYYSEQSVVTVREETFAEAMSVLLGQQPRTVANPRVLEKVKLAPREA